MKIAITGIGMISSAGDSVRANIHAFRRDVPFPKKIEEFDYRRYCDVRGMRSYPRLVQLQVSSAFHALRHAGVDIDMMSKDMLGTVCASTFGHTATAVQYDGDLVTKGTHKTNPTLFPMALHSCPGAITALSLGARAFAMTVSDGDRGGLMAIATGARMIRQGRADVVVVSSASAVGIPGVQELFGRDSSDMAVSLVLESEGYMIARGGRSLGYVLGFGQAFSTDIERPWRANEIAIVDALAASGLTTATAHVWPAPNETRIGAIWGETLDAQGLANVVVGLAEHSEKVWVASRSLTGSCSSLVLECIADTWNDRIAQ